MGSVVLTEDDNAIIDGQQRLTSITLLLIYLYHRLENEDDRSGVMPLIYSQKVGIKTFNIDVPDMPERNTVMNALLKNEYLDVTDQAETIKNIHGRYKDIESVLDGALTDEALEMFKD